MSTNGHVILCYQLRVYGKCPYGDKCPFSHDLNAEAPFPTLPGAVKSVQSPSKKPERPHKPQDHRSNAPKQRSKNSEPHNGTGKDHSHLSEQQHQRSKSQQPEIRHQAAEEARTITAQMPETEARDIAGPPTYEYPQLHSAVQEAVTAYIPFVWYRENGVHGPHSIDNYLTNIIGFFNCRNGSCKSKGWGSLVVAIQIKSYPDNGYDAVVFGQRCLKCNVMGCLVVDQQVYVDRVAYRLKKWAGFEMEPPPYGGGAKAPHERRLCEGCRRGLCPQSPNRGLM